MDDVVRIVDLLSEKTKEFSDLYTKLEGELEHTLGAEGGLKDEYTNSAAAIKALKDEKKALTSEKTELKRKSYKVGNFDKLDWAEYQVIVTKLGLSDEAVATLNSAETVEFDETQQAIINDTIAPYFTADKINSRMYAEVKAARANRNARIKEIDARLSDIEIEVEDMSLEQTDKLKANLNNASQERKDKLAEISVQFKDNKKFLEQFGDQVNSNVLYLDDEIVSKRRLIDRLEKNELAVEQKEKAQKDLENLEKYRKFYKEVLQDNLLEKYKNLFGDNKKITGEKINEINDQMQILFDVLENANKEDIDDLIEKVEKIANKIGKIEYTVDLTPGVEDIKVTNKKGVTSIYDEAKLAYFQNQNTLFKVNYEVDGVKYTKVVDYNGLLELHDLNLGKDQVQEQEQVVEKTEEDSLKDMISNAFEMQEQELAAEQAQESITEEAAVENTETVNNTETVAAPVTTVTNTAEYGKMLKVLKGRKSKIADKTKAENVAAGLAIGGGLVAQIAAFTPLLASNPIGISVAVGAAVVYNREKIKNVFVKAAERMKARKVEKQLDKICREFNNSEAGKLQHQIAVRYDLNDHIAQIVRNTTGEKDINGWTPITAEDAVAITNGAGKSLQDRIDEVFNAELPTRTFINENGEEETITRDVVKAEAITTAFQLYGGVMKHGESQYDEYKADELAAAYAKAVNAEPSPIVDATPEEVVEEAPEIEPVQEETQEVENVEELTEESPTEEAPAEETVDAPAEEAPAQEEPVETTQEELAASVQEMMEEPKVEETQAAPVLEGVNFPQPMNVEPVVENTEGEELQLLTDVAKRIKANEAIANTISNVIKANEYTEGPEITIIGQDPIQPSQSENVLTAENPQELKTEFVSDNVPEEVDFKEAFEDVLLEAGLENSDQIYDLDDEQYRHLIETAETLLSQESNKIPVVITMIEQFRKDKSIANDPELAGPRM